MAKESRHSNSSTPSNGGQSGIQHAGWLTKQGGARGGFKNWKRRWFTLKQDCLYYYKSGPATTGANGAFSSPEEGTLLGVLPLFGAHIHDGNATDPLPDSSVCFECKRAFSLLNKRQQCLICTQHFCKNCSSYKVLLPSLGFDKRIKTCRSCYTKIVSNVNAGTAPDLKATAGGTAAAMAAAAVLAGAGTATACSTVGTSVPATTRPLTADRLNAFVIQTPDRELVLQAESNEDKLDWIEVIQQAIDRRAVAEAGGDSSNANLNGTAMPDNIQSKPTHENWEIDYSQLTILDKIGDGAFGEVFKGRLWGTDVAIKKVKTKEINEKTLLDLKNEVAILSQLRHPNIVLYIGACTVPPNVCIITEWCDHGSLFDVIYKNKMILSTKKAMDIAIGLAQGMSYLHSLERGIIHRDLKSHNVLLDQNFTVKIADFGLSHMKEAGVVQRREMGTVSATSDSRGGDDDPEDSPEHYGIFGTPEWMAPEVMEGSAYTKKIDVYSFGVVLTELVARQIPLRDQYKITNYMDVFEAVLDDGARPTIPDWIGPKLHRLITECLDVLPERRPTFLEIIARLAYTFHLSSRMIFKQFDVPRLFYMLTSPRPHMQELAASELALCRQADQVPCINCGQGPSLISSLDTEIIMQFVEKLSILLRIGSEKTMEQCCLALIGLLNGAQLGPRQIYKEIILKECGLGKLMEHVHEANIGFSSKVKVLILTMAPDILRPHNEALQELDQNTATVLRDIVQEDLQGLMAKLSDLQSLITSKKELVESLRQSNFGSKSLNPLRTNSTTSMTSAPRNEVIQEPFIAPEISTLPLPGLLTLEFAEFVSKNPLQLIISDNALVFDVEKLIWSIAFVLLFPGELHVFSSSNASPRSCLAIVRISANPNTTITLGRKGSKPHCVYIQEHTDSIVFCTRNSEQAYLWKQSLTCSGSVMNSSVIPAQANLHAATSAKKIVRLLHQFIRDQLSVKGNACPPQYRSALSESGRSGWLLGFDPEIGVWFPTYALVEIGETVKLFESNQPVCPRPFSIIHISDQFNNDDECARCTMVTSSDANMTKTSSETSFDFNNILFEIDDGDNIHQFAALNKEDRDQWVAQCNRRVDQSQLSTVDQFSLMSTKLTTLPVDLRNQIIKSNLRRKVSDKPIARETIIATKPIEPVKERIAAVVDDAFITGFPDDKGDQIKIDHVQNGVNVKKRPSEFVKLFGESQKSGYLLKRGGFRKNWKLRYFYLVRNELRYFVSHTSSPSEVLGTVYTTTGSGKRFSVFPDSKAHKEFCFCVENPSRTWYLAAHSDHEMNEWMSAIQLAAISSAAKPNEQN